jgi:transcriptional accessory protein Tex/SPT6
MIAREAGLEPLADKLFADPSLDPLAEAAPSSTPRPASPMHRGARRRARPAVRALGRGRALVGTLREWLWAKGCCAAKRMDGKDENDPDVAKFRDYFDYDEPIRTCRRTARWRCSAAARRSASMRSWCSTRSRCPGSRAWPRAASRATSAGATASAPPTS